MAITKKVAERIQSGLKRFTPILAAQRDRDVSEADTVTLVKDLLSDVFGYDKYSELTSEHAIRGTFCDLAIQFDGKLQLLIEVKAIGSALQERHVKQSIDYAFQAAACKLARDLTEKGTAAWSYDVEEFPVSCAGGGTSIDLIVTRGNNALLIETKRVMAGEDWVFFKSH